MSTERKTCISFLTIITKGMCSPVGSCMYSEPYNQLRHFHPPYRSTLIFTWYLNFIIETAKNSSWQRYINHCKDKQYNLMLKLWCLALVEEHCRVSLDELKHAAVPLWVPVAPQSPSAWFGNHRPKHSRLRETRARFFSMVIFWSHLFLKLPPGFHVGLCVPPLSA